MTWNPRSSGLKLRRHADEHVNWARSLLLSRANPSPRVGHDRNLAMLKTIARKFDPEQDAIDLLKQDHRKVEALFKEFGGADDKRTKQSLARQICAELDVHARIEEKLFYTAAKHGAPESTDDVNEGIVEHEGIKRLVKQLSSMSASDELFESRMTVLEEYVKHHVKEEESAMFPKIVESDVDLKALGRKLANEKHKLQAASKPPKANGQAAASRGARA